MAISSASCTNGLSWQSRISGAPSNSPKHKAAGKSQKDAAAKDAEIQGLKAKLDAIETAQKLAITEAVSAVEKERDELKERPRASELEKQLAEKSLKDKYETQIKDRDDAIERFKDMKASYQPRWLARPLSSTARPSSTAFARLRFRAPISRRTTTRGGSKGDYIFRDSDDAGTEFISIMFEMKNESDATATKKKNEDFFKELDKDRNEKGCEYAVLVSLLEPDSELYNTGIVDVFHRYPKMYVIRPQFFIPMITLASKCRA